MDVLIRRESFLAASFLEIIRDCVNPLFLFYLVSVDSWKLLKTTDSSWFAFSRKQAQQ